MTSTPSLDALREYLGGNTPVSWRYSTVSTNEDARAAARNGALSGHVFLAEAQSHGRGRLGRMWAAEPGSSILMSLLLRPSAPARTSSALGLAVGLGVCAAVQDVCRMEPQLKWPNDVMLSGRKFCGILIESTLAGDSIEYAIVGIGMNVNQNVFYGELGSTATSLRIETGRAVERARLAARVIQEVRRYADAYFLDGIDKIIDEYKMRSSVLEKDIIVHRPEGPKEGRCVGFGACGEIMVQEGDQIVLYASNDVSIRQVNRDV